MMIHRILAAALFVALLSTAAAKRSKPVVLQRSVYPGTKEAVPPIHEALQLDQSTPHSNVIHADAPYALYKFACAPRAFVAGADADGVGEATVMFAADGTDQTSDNADEEDGFKGLNIYVSAGDVPSPLDHIWSGHLKAAGEPMYIRSSDERYPEDGIFYAAVTTDGLEEHMHKIPFAKGREKEIEEAANRLVTAFMLRAVCVVKEDPKASWVESARHEKDSLPANSAINNNSRLGDTVIPDGVPTVGSLSSGHYSITYSYYLSGNYAFEASIAPRYGDPDLYVTTDGSLPTPTNYQFRSVHYGGDFVIAYPGTFGYCTDCTWRITVTEATQLPSQYVILVLNSHSTVTLVEGVPLQMTEPGGNTVYTRFDNTAGVAGQTITVSATALSGDPDIYGSLTTHYPGPGDHQWSATRFGSDALSITPSSRDVYYFGFRAALNRSVIATLAVATETPVILTTGTPEYGTVTNGRTIYYEVAILNPNATSNGNRNVTISLTVVSGLANMFLGRNYFPNSSTYDQRTYSFESQTTLTMIQNSTVCPRGFCNYYIGIQAIASNTSFSLVSSFSDTVINNTQHTVLMEGVAVAEHVPAHGWRYFTYDNADSDSALRVDVGTLSGDPDVYVTIPPQASPYPSPTDNSFYSRAYGNDTITIPQYMAIAGRYYIAVYGYLESDFEITVDSVDSNITLIDGVPEEDDVDAGENIFYVFTLNTNDTGATMTWSFDIDEGPTAASLYLSNGVVPTVTSYEYTSTGDDLVVHNAEDGVWYALVHGRESTGFSVEVDVGDVLEELAEGDVARRTLQSKNDKAYFYLNVDSWNSSSRLRIAVTPVGQCDPDLYVSTVVTHPTDAADGHTWQGNTVGGDEVEILGTDPNACACPFYIAVQTLSPNCTFDIVASFPPSNVITLDDGNLVDGSLEGTEGQMYMFEVASESTVVQFIVTSVQNGVTFYVGANTQPNPNAPSSYNWHQAVQATGDQAKISVHSSDPGFCQGCQYYVFVQANGASTTTYYNVLGHQS